MWFCIRALFHTYAAAVKDARSWVGLSLGDAAGPLRSAWHDKAWNRWFIFKTSLTCHSANQNVMVFDVRLQIATFDQLRTQTHSYVPP